ncbi:MAG TPA: SCE4755 family polysaccharide monooxygenase-like protein [Candidatus Kryptonia bacterium]|nr:SCE4755 family polysaccharide monooxygenase-like protein [Candidatus Kryptonia bacterium]
MLRFKAKRTERPRLIGCTLLAAVSGIFAPVLAHAHFILVAPDSWMSQDDLGLPEKLGPCGDEGGGTPTGKVTAFRPGQAIAVTIDEVITHPGHYRVALAMNDHSELPPEPLVTPTGNDPCASAAIQNPPTFPILADNVLPHTQAFGKPQTFTVTLPANITCTKCTLQVLEFMSSHTAPCFYHHCADISIQAEVEAATPTPSPTNTQTPTRIAAQTPTASQTASAPGTPTQIPTPSIMPTPVSARPCVGDCDHNQSVTVDELVVLVRIALGELPSEFCPALDPNNGNLVTVDVLVTAVNNDLSGCPAVVS